jgi:hypothetical protein
LRGGERAGGRIFGTNTKFKLAINCPRIIIMTSILQVLGKVMNVFGNLIAHIEAFNEPILRNFEQSQFFELLAQSLKYFIPIPFFDAILFSRPLRDTMSNGVIKYYVWLDIADF